MLKNLLAAAFLLTPLATGMAADTLVKDDFEALAEGNSLSDLTNWRFYAGWIKPEFGKIVVENGNKFLRFHGDFFAKTPSTLEEKMTYRFKIRAAGTDEELGGLCLRAPDSKNRYDLLFAYKHDAITLSQDVGGTRDELARVENAAKNNAFQEVVVVIERVTSGVKFTVTVDGSKVIDKVDSHALPLLSESFNAGFFTFNQKSVDIDDIEFTRGR